MRKPRVFATRGDEVTLALGKSPSEPNYVSSGNTQNFYFFYQRTLGVLGDEICKTLLARCEGDYQTLGQTFSVVPRELPFHVYVTADISGAMHYGCVDTEIYVGTLSSMPPSTNTYNLLLQAEVVEVFEATIGGGWNCGFSHGEGLSRVLATWLYPNDQIADLVTAPTWLDKTLPVQGNRFNWIDDTDRSDTHPTSVGCAVLFLNWLHYALGKSWNQIVATGGKTLAETYEKLFGQPDGWAVFKGAIDARFPPGQPSGLKSDNPF